ncbi:gloverin-like [Aphomia sociella]
MKSLYIFASVLIVVAAQDYETHPQIIITSYPEWYRNEYPHPRHQRDLSVDKNTGDVTLDHKTSPDGRIFGTLGSRDESLFGKAGYQHNVFDDHRGKLDASAYGSRVLSPYGASSNLGGRLDYKNDNAAASLDLSRQIGGFTAVDAAAGGRWPIGKNGDFTVQGTYSRFGPIQDYGARAGLNYRW